mgnify:FL=1
MRALVLFSSLAFVLASAGCNGDFELPPEIGSSKYLIFHTDVDASVVCMDDFLAREDQFIERTAMILGVEPPTEPIHFVWDLEQSGREPWACNDNSNCFKYLADEDLSLVVSQSPTNHHELVHALDAQALGTNAHRTLEEGLAEYLGSLQTSVFPQDFFPAAFTSMLDKSPIPSDYSLAMHFVGSVFALYGSDKFKELRARMPATARSSEFSAVFESVYGQRFDTSINAFGANQVYAIDRFPGCEDGTELVWSNEKLLDVSVYGSCGDPWFFGAGSVKGRIGFFGYYVVQVPLEGEYELTVGPEDGAPAPFRGFLSACSFDILGSQALSLNGKPGVGQLKSGTHTLLIAFPPQSEARGAAKVRLEYIGPSSQP